MDIYYGKADPNYKLYFHLVIVTKFRAPVFDIHNQERVEAIIKMKCKQAGYHIRATAIQKDHVHLLLSLKPIHAIPDVVKNIKGFSAHTFNKLFDKKLIWQPGYSISTVSEEALLSVKKYIENQKEI